METPEHETRPHHARAALEEWQIEELRLGTELCFHALAETAADGVITIDENSRILYVNPAAEKTFGYRVSEMLNKDLTMLMPEYLRAMHRASVDRHKSTAEKHCNWECVPVTGLHHDGHEIPLEISFGAYERNGHRFFTGFVRDVSERERLNQRFHNSEEKFSKVFHSSPDAVVITQLEDGRYLEVNDSFTRLTGWQREEVIGRTSLELGMWSIPEQRHKLVERLQEQGSVREMDFEFRKKSGEKYAAAVSAELLMLDSTTVVVSVVRDVSQQRKAESQLRELTGRLIHEQDLERRRVARELHDSTAQSLAALAINLAALEAVQAPRSQREAEVLRDCHELTDSALRELRTMTCLLHPPVLEEAGLAGAVPWFVESFEKRSSISVELHMPPAIPRLSEQRELTIYRLIQESLSNVHRHSGSSKVRIDFYLHPDHLVLEVMDFGHGFSSATNAADQAGAQIGVGIQGMRERVRQLGGHLEILSNHTGTTVRAELPLEQHKAASSS